MFHVIKKYVAHWCMDHILKSWSWWVVVSSKPMEPQIFFGLAIQIVDWVPRGCPCLGHMAPPHLTKNDHVSNSNWICHPHLPSQRLPHVTLPLVQFYIMRCRR
jgi:hypothetical protein